MDLPAQAVGQSPADMRPENVEVPGERLPKDALAGMGGQESGEHASSLAVEIIVNSH